MKKYMSLKSLLSATAGLVFLLALINGVLFPATAQGPLTLPESRGKQIYMRGISPSGKDVVAYLGQASLEVPGTTMACANCHGANGQGKPEGGVDPLNLTWEMLSKPSAHADGRRRLAYTERSLELAITRGIDPAGNKLANVMPRYQMSKEDLADLIIYMKQVGKDRDPGISESKVLIGSAVPEKGPLAEMGQAVKAVITAYFDEINTQGGVHNRRLELKFTDTGETPAATRANLEHFLKDEQVFALTGALIAGSEKEIVPLMAEQGVPLIGPITLFPQSGSPLNRQVFYLLCGLDGQARALINFVAGKPELRNLGPVAVYPRSEINEDILMALKDQGTKAALKAVEVRNYAAGGFDAAETVKQLKQQHRDSVVFFLGSTQELLSFMQEADKLSWFPTLMLSSAISGAGIFGAPVGFDGKVFFSFPTSPVDQTSEAIKEFRALAEKYKLSPKHVAAQISAYSAARILAAALKQAGKDLSRERLIQVLEELHEYHTGLTPAITYGPNRRIGAMGAYVVTLDLKTKQFVPASGWVNVVN